MNARLPLLAPDVGAVRGGFAGAPARLRSAGLVPFDVDVDGDEDLALKEARFQTDPVLGWPNLHPAAQAMLLWQADLCELRGWANPVVTEFGRTRADMERLYLPGLLQDLELNGLEGDAIAVEGARRAARGRWSRHCVPLDERGRPLPFAAYDLRHSVWTPAQRDELLVETLRKFGGPAKVEALLHKLVGNAWHFHFAAKVGEKPARWL